MKRLYAADQLPTIDPPAEGPEFLVVANRLPIDRDDSGDEPGWKTAPGGLVTGLAPVVRRASGAWIGWPGITDTDVDPFEHDGMHLVPVRLSSEDFQMYYEGFSNGTLWPLFHDVIAPPAFHRTWWDKYLEVNTRFAIRTAETAGKNATVWVHDYQLFLVPQLLRSMRPDVSIGFFLHIPFPPVELYSQLPWRSEILRGVQGADLIGFQRPTDAANFRRCVRKHSGFITKGDDITVTADPDLGTEEHITRAAHYPISVDTDALIELANTPAIQARAQEIRRELGNPDIVILGTDRMDYTKGLRHRLKAVHELLREGRLDKDKVTFVQIATPSRERLDHYKQIRTEVELAVGHTNGEFSGLHNQVIHYFHYSFPRDEMTAFYLAADVMLVTPLRDGMNLVAKEYTACRTDDSGALVLSEFAGAADQLTQAVLINPHDITELKNGIMRAVGMEVREQRRRMRPMRRRLKDETVHTWARSFLSDLAWIAGAEPVPLETAAISLDAVRAGLDGTEVPGEVPGQGQAADSSEVPGQVPGEVPGQNSGGTAP